VIADPPSDHSDGAAPDTSWQPDRMTARLLIGATAAVLFGFALLLLRFTAFETLVRLVADLVSPDGVVTATGRSQLGRLMLGVTAVVLTTGLFLLALANARWRATVDSVMSWDALRHRGLQVPHPYWALACSAGSGALIAALWFWRGHLGPTVESAFAKEGFFEDVTFVLEIAGAVMCATAAIRWKVRDGASTRVVRILFALCALGLFFVGMEEVNWGQTLLGFQTPPSWAAINYQHETSVHNLLSRTTLTETTRLMAFAFGIVVLGMIVWSARAPRSIVGEVAPPVSLAPLAMIITAGGLLLHPEVLELLLSLFFAFYSYRIVIAAGRSAEAQAGARDVPLAHAIAAGERRDRWWSTELLEYTHDAIIIWELDGAGILYWNGAAERLYGYSRDEAHGCVTHELLKTRLAGGVSNLEQALARFGIWVGELQHTTRQGRTVVVDARLALMAQDNGRWLVLEVNRDVTDLKVAEAERQAVERQLAELRSRHDVP
jgi:PAS domain S-box-containing protein